MIIQVRTMLAQVLGKVGQNYANCSCCCRQVRQVRTTLMQLQIRLVKDRIAIMQARAMLTQVCKHRLSNVEKARFINPVSVLEEFAVFCMDGLGLSGKYLEGSCVLVCGGLEGGATREVCLRQFVGAPCQPVQQAEELDQDNQEVDWLGKIRKYF